MTAATKPRPNGKRTQEIGVSGLRMWYGQNMEEWLPALQYTRRLQVYREMADNDPTIGAMLRAMTILARQVPWHFQHENDQDPRIEVLEQAKRDMEQPWADFITEALYGQLVFGWAYLEIVYQENENGIGWRKFAPRAQDTLNRWLFADEDQRVLTGMEQLAPPQYRLITIPLSKALHIRSESRKDNPEGVSILRNCYRPWYFKKHIENVEAIGIERDLAGLPVIYAPARLFGDTVSAGDTAILDELKRIVINIRRDEQEGIVMPNSYDEHGNKLYELALLSSAGERQFNTDAVINRLDLRILQTAMADFLQVGHEKVGSFALQSSKTNLFAVSLGVGLDQIAGAFNQRAVPDLLELNGLDPEDPPELVHGDLEQQDLAEYGTFLSACASAGMPLFPDRDVENVLRQKLGLEPLTSKEWEEKEEERAEREAEQLEQQMEMAMAGKPAPAGEKPEPKDKEPS